jgi:hypothetical protein
VSESEKKEVFDEYIDKLAIVVLNHNKGEHYWNGDRERVNQWRDTVKYLWQRYTPEERDKLYNWIQAQGNMNYERAVPTFESFMRAAGENRPLFSSELWDRKRQRTGNNALDFFEYAADAYLEQVRIHGGNVAEYKRTIDRLRNAIKSSGNTQWRQSEYGTKLDKLQNKHGQFNWEAELRDLTNMLDVPQNIPIKPIPTGTPPVVQPWEDQSLLPQPALAPTPTDITPSVAHRAGGVIHGVTGDVLVNDHGRDQNRPPQQPNTPVRPGGRGGGAGSLNRQANNMRWHPPVTKTDGGGRRVEGHQL